MTNKMIDLRVVINPLPEDDVIDIERTTRELREELKQLDLEHVDLVTDENLPKGAKGMGVEVWGQLLVSLFASGGVAASLIGVLQTRVKRDGHSIKISRKNQTGATEEIELTGSSDKGEQELIHWITKDDK